VFVPFFFIVSRMKLDVAALFASPSGVIKCFVFFVLFLVVRGTPALVLYRRVLTQRQRASLAFLSSTQLPLVVAITDLAIASGHMRASTAAALVGAATLSTLVYPIAGLRMATALSRDVPLVGAAVVGESQPAGLDAP
jgi:Kef-type K+ transport system membrane component KefB